MKTCPNCGKNTMVKRRLLLKQAGAGLDEIDPDTLERIEYICQRCGYEVNNYNGVTLVFNGSGLFVRTLTHVRRQ